MAARRKASSTSVAKGTRKRMKTDDSGEKEKGGGVAFSMKERSSEGKAPSDSSEKHHWLVKSEPNPRFVNGVDVSYAIEKLMAEPDQISCWDGVRNAEARNILRDSMHIGDMVLFYHSNCKEPGIVGIVEVVKEGYPDSSQFDKASPYYDPKSRIDSPKWFMVDIKFVRKLKRFITLAELQQHYKTHSSPSDPLYGMSLFTRRRLSVQPVTPEQFKFIVELEEAQK